MRTPCLQQSQPGPGNSLLQTHRKAKAPLPLLSGKSDPHPGQPSVLRNDLEGTIVGGPTDPSPPEETKVRFHPSIRKSNTIRCLRGQFTGPPKKEELRTAGGNVVWSKLASGTGPHSRCPQDLPRKAVLSPGPSPQQQRGFVLPRYCQLPNISCSSPDLFPAKYETGPHPTPHLGPLENRIHPRSTEAHQGTNTLSFSPPVCAPTQTAIHSRPEAAGQIINRLARFLRQPALQQSSLALSSAVRLPPLNLF